MYSVILVFTMSKTTHISITKIRNGISYNTLHEKVKSQYENGFNSYKENAKGPSHKNNKFIRVNKVMLKIP